MDVEIWRTRMLIEWQIKSVEMDALEGHAEYQK